MSSSNWLRILSEAERIVGVPTHFINLQYLLTEEWSLIASQLKRLATTQHPLLLTTRKLLSNQKNYGSSRGLVTLLIGNSFKHLSPRQRSLADIIETVHAGMSIHRSVVDLNDNIEMKTFKNMEFGNKMATLGGGILLTSVSTQLAKLENTEIVAMVSEGMSDNVESDFCSLVTPLDDYTPNSHDWQAYVNLREISLFSKCNRAIVKLQEHPLDIEPLLESFARHWCQMFRIGEELSWLKLIPTSPESPFQCSVDLLAGGVEHSYTSTLHYIESGANDLDQYLSLPESIDECCGRVDEHGKSLLEIIGQFPNNDCSQILSHIVKHCSNYVLSSYSK